MEIEFDAEKDAGNLSKHGVSLGFGARVFDDPNVLILPTIREADEEERFKAVGLVGGALWTAIHVWRGPVVRFISVRRSNSGERRAYDSDPG